MTCLVCLVAAYVIRKRGRTVQSACAWASRWNIRFAIFPGEVVYLCKRRPPRISPFWISCRITFCQTLKWNVTNIKLYRKLYTSSLVFATMDNAVPHDATINTISKQTLPFIQPWFLSWRIHLLLTNRPTKWRLQTLLLIKGSAVYWRSVRPLRLWHLERVVCRNWRRW